jgi:hypothetical protein
MRKFDILLKLGEFFVGSIWVLKLFDIAEHFGQYCHFWDFINFR